jgi:HK97 family phage portal protein
MGLFEKIFKRPNKEFTRFFQTLGGYSPVYSSFTGGIYEMELIRAVINSFATACSKLKPEISGSAYKHLEHIWQFKPNPFMTTSQFLYRIATILSVCNNAFIVPMEDELGRIIGFYPILPQNCELLELPGAAGGELYLRYTFANGKKASIEFSRVALLTQFQYEDDFFGSYNLPALKSTLDLLHTQSQSIIQGVRNSANVRFIGSVKHTLDNEDLASLRNDFTAANLSSENHSGLILYDAKIGDLQAIQSKAVIVDYEQTKLIQNNVFTYFGTNEDILQNKFSEDTWNAYYEGKIEPFALQLSLAISNMLYTSKELAYGNNLIFTSNRLQYASNKTKLELSEKLFDRGLINRNGVMDIWNMAHVEDGEKYYIRREYVEIDKLGEVDGNRNAVQGLKDTAGNSE